MSSTYARFLSDGSGPNSLSDSWPGWQGYAVRTPRRKVDYGYTPDRSASNTSLGERSFDEKVVAMADPARQLPPMPEIGRPESYYASLIRFAEREGNSHLHESAKVGQYVTLAIDPSLAWDEKLKYFRHALKRHCSPPPYPDDDLWLFYKGLADLVRQHCGHEALRLASAEDDMYAARLSMDQPREDIENDAEVFFFKLLGGTGDQRPEWYNDTDWQQLKVLRDQWI